MKYENTKNTADCANAQAAFEMLKQLSMRGTVRLTIGAMNRQCQLTYWTESSKRDLRGTLEDILSKAATDSHWQLLPSEPEKPEQIEL